MEIFSPIYVETLLVALVSHTEFNSPTEHHLVAVHEVVHDVFKFWHQCLLIDQVKVDHILSRNLNSHISFDEEQKTFFVKSMKLLPLAIFVLLWLPFFIFVDFEKHDFLRTSSNQDLVVYEIHVTKTLIGTGSLFIF